MTNQLIETYKTHQKQVEEFENKMETATNEQYAEEICYMVNHIENLKTIGGISDDDYQSFVGTVVSYTGYTDDAIEQSVKELDREDLEQFFFDLYNDVKTYLS